MENSITDPSRNMSIENDLQMFKDWLEKQIHLPKDVDDEMLLLFIKGCKSLEIAKKKFDKFCTTNTKYPDQLVLPNSDENYKEYFEYMKIFFLPEPLPDGCRVMMALGKDPEKYNHRFNNIRLRTMALLLRRMYPDMLGLVIVMDAATASLGVFQRMSITQSVTSSNIIQNYVPVPVKQAVVYNSNPATEMILNNLVIPFFSKKIQQRIVVTSEGEGILKNFLPPEILPCDFPGGKAPSSDQLNEEGIKLLESHRDWFEKIVQWQADEDKRPPDAENTYGVEGTFKKLNVD